MIAERLHPWLEVEPYTVSVDEYRSFRRDGYLVVRGLVKPEHVNELKAHTEEILSGELDFTRFVHCAPGSPPPSAADVHRIHQGHEKIELWERYLLYPRILDVVQALVGPDVMAMQTMLFTKGPGSNGQGFHQDTFYIPTFPDSLIGAWIAIDPADTENGCLWMSPGSGHEPVYPPEGGYGHGDANLGGIEFVRNVGGHSNDDADPLNTLKPIAERYKDREFAVEVDPGDVVLFSGHVFHRSLKNRSEDRYRRSFVNHYANARSYTLWGGGNGSHILARGNTHLAYGEPRFGTPCAANDPERTSIVEGVDVPEMMMATPMGTMAAQEPGGDHED